MFLGHGSEEEQLLDYVQGWNHAEIPSKDIVEAGNRLISLTFWQRLWITQEVVLAGKGTLLARKSSMDLDTFLEKVDVLLAHSTSSTSFVAVQRIASLRQSTPRDAPLMTLLQDFQQCQSTNPVDKVYGLLSLVSNPSRVAKKLELGKDKTAQQVFWDIVLECWFANFDFRKISTVLAPMYSVHGAALCLKSLQNYARDTKNTISGDHHKQAETILATVRAVNALMRSYVPFYETHQRAKWQDVLQCILPSVSKNPETFSFTVRETRQILFNLALDIAMFTANTALPSATPFYKSADTYGWRRAEQYRHPYGSEGLMVIDPFYLESIPSKSLIPPLQSQSPSQDFGFVFEFTGGRLEVLPFEPSGFWKLRILSSS
jgi:hypothetical protein